jgi:GTP-binding protein Era
MSGETSTTKAGFCAILGLPNAGKSTLLNGVLGRRLAAVSSKPQTTRNRILGVHAVDAPEGVKSQIAYVDTPGLQLGAGALRRFMRDQAVAASTECDVVLLMIDAADRGARRPQRLDEQDAAPLAAAARRAPVVIALNKVDRVAKPDLLPLIEQWAAWSEQRADVIPICATTGDGVARVEAAVAARLPDSPFLFPAEMMTDRAESFLASELIREQLYHQLGKELPYAAAVVIETFEERERGDVAIGAKIVVERQSQKAIVVGRGGQRIKQLGIAARQAVSDLLGCPVHVSLHVSVEPDWSRDARGIYKLGYSDPT